MRRFIVAVLAAAVTNHVAPAAAQQSSPNLATPISSRDTASPPARCNATTIGGTVAVSAKVTLVVSLRAWPDSLLIIGVAVARADESLRSMALLELPKLGEPHGGGGSVGRWIVSFEDASSALWVGPDRIDLNGRNVVLLQGLDRINTSPDIAGMLSLPGVVRRKRCGEFAEVVRGHVLASREVREFIARGTPPAR